ncbi:uncharacterized protein LOC116842611 [Odontomachus brunneus]|uniref:uncharacterized protein LOC116842611 n=1 Tax=Odontomachus brunneus TaxID=486640 RepID=UPI0013F2034B|nr:uncharacterized protein LOC116842611 [Odontomachus brunneus]
MSFILDFFFTRCQNLSKRYVIRYIIVRIFLCGKERKVDEEIPCLRQLLHWNEHPAEGRGKTHAAIVHRLRQIGRDDLADWLGKTAFKQLGKDLNDAIAPSPEMPSVDEQTETVLTFRATAKSVTWLRDEDPWLPIDTILLALVLGLLGTLFILIAAIIVHTIQNNKK